MSRSRVKVRYKPDYKGMGEFMVSEQARRPAVEAAQDIVAALASGVRRSHAKKGPEGHLADSYKVNGESEPVSVAGKPRAGAEVYSSHPGAAPEEFGGKKNKAKHWLADIAAGWHVPRTGGGE